MRLANIYVAGAAKAVASLGPKWVDLEALRELPAGQHPGGRHNLRNLLPPQPKVAELLGNPEALKQVSDLVHDLGLATTVEESDPGDLVISTEDWAYRPPILRPGKVLCVGLNYPSPAMEGGPEHPVLFHKVATALTADGQPVWLPRETTHLSYEGELAVVIGVGGRRIPAARALKHVGGYTIANDIGAPELQARTSQWTSGKMLDSFCPLGPVLVTPDEIEDPHGLWIRTSLNGELVQSESTGAMLFKVPRLIEYISSLVTLEPGDLILTGSPKRVDGKPDPQIPMAAGDRVVVEIEPVGKLYNIIQAEEV